MAETWLILSHAFNMDGRAASQMITAKIPHLLRHGIRPVVVSAVTGTKDAVVEHHQLLPVSPAGLRFDLRHVIRRRVRSQLAYRVATTLVFLPLLPFYALEKLLVPLDSHWSWFIPAYFRGAKLVRRHRPTVIYSTAGAICAHMAGYLLARRFKLPWVAEIQDPFVRVTQERVNIAARFAGWLEGKVCRHAAVAIWYTEAALRRARERHPELGARGHWMYTGADAPVAPKTPYARGPRFVFAHFGSLSPSRNVATFLAALEEFLSREPQRRSQVRVHLYGNLDNVSQRAIEDFPFPGVIGFYGRIERRRADELMAAADCLLLVHDQEPSCDEYIPSKTYDYLATRRPVLGLVASNPEMTNVLRSTGHYAVSLGDPAAIAQAIGELLDRWDRDDLKDSARASPYTVEAAVEQMLGWVRAAQTRNA